LNKRLRLLASCVGRLLYQERGEAFAQRTDDRLVHWGMLGSTK
jgi:hypothetical protein